MIYQRFCNICKPIITSSNLWVRSLFCLLCCLLLLFKISVVRNVFSLSFVQSIFANMRSQAKSQCFFLYKLIISVSYHNRTKDYTQSSEPSLLLIGFHFKRNLSSGYAFWKFCWQVNAQNQHKQKKNRTKTKYWAWLQSNLWFVWTHRKMRKMLKCQLFKFGRLVFRSNFHRLSVMSWNKFDKCLGWHLIRDNKLHV